MRAVRLAATMLCVGAVVAVVGTDGTSSAAFRARERRDPWLMLLDRVPASGTFGDSVVINDYKAARAAADVPRSSNRVKDLLRLEQATGVAFSGLMMVNGPGDPLADELGIRSRTIERDLDAGHPPDELTILEGSIDAGDVKQTVEADDNFSDLLETAQHAGARYYTWGSGRLDPKRRSPVRPLGVGGNLAVDPPYATWSNEAKSVEASIDAAAGNEASLADDRDVKAVALELHEQGAYSAFISLNEIAPGVETGGPAPMAPYDAIAIGPSLAGSEQPEMIIVLVYADATTAQEQADRLQAIAENGTNITGDPWSDLVAVDDISTNGRLVIGRFLTDKPHLWFDIVVRGDSLLATT